MEANVMTKQHDEEQLSQLAKVLYSLPVDVKRQLLESAAEYLVAEGQAEQLSLLFDIDGDKSGKTARADAQRVKGQAQKGTVHPKNKLK